VKVKAHVNIHMQSSYCHKWKTKMAKN